jgi:hypothetical protein
MLPDTGTINYSPSTLRPPGNSAVWCLGGERIRQLTDNVAAQAVLAVSGSRL